MYSPTLPAKISSNQDLIALRKPACIITPSELLLEGVAPTIARIIQRRWARIAICVSLSPALEAICDHEKQELGKIL